MNLLSLAGFTHPWSPLLWSLCLGLSLLAVPPAALFAQSGSFGAVDESSKKYQQDSENAKRKRQQGRLSAQGNSELNNAQLMKMMQDRRRQMRNQPQGSNGKLNNKSKGRAKGQNSQNKNQGKSGAASMDQREQQILRMLTRADVNNDRKISREEAPPMMKDRFDRIDTDSDGFISVDEVKAMLQLLRQRMQDGNGKAGNSKMADGLQERMRKQAMQRMQRNNGNMGPPVKPIRPGQLK